MHCLASRTNDPAYVNRAHICGGQSPGVLQQRLPDTGSGRSRYLSRGQGHGRLSANRARCEHQVAGHCGWQESGQGIGFGWGASVVGTSTGYRVNQCKHESITHG